MKLGVFLVFIDLFIYFSQEGNTKPRINPNFSPKVARHLSWLQKRVVRNEGNTKPEEEIRLHPQLNRRKESGK